jgi:hypothetical protein
MSIIHTTFLKFRHKVGAGEAGREGLGSFEKQGYGSYGKRNTRSFFSGDLKEKKEKRGKGPGLLRIEEKIIPFAFRRRKLPIYFYSISL